MHDDYPITGTRYQAYQFISRSPKTILADPENEKHWSSYNKQFENGARFKLVPRVNAKTDSQGKETEVNVPLVYGYTSWRQGEREQVGVLYDGWVSTISSELLLPLLSADLTESERLVQIFSFAKTVSALLPTKESRGKAISLT